MDVEDLEVIVAIAELGSLTAAAERLHVAQPAISRRLARLERELGGRLFERGRSGAHPTPAGHVVADQASVVLGGIRELERDAREAIAGHGGRLRIGTTPTLGADLMPRALGIHRRSHPAVRFEVISSGDSSGLVAAVRDGRIDVALAVVPPTIDAQLRVAVEGPQPFVLVLPAGHRLASLRAVPLHELVGERLVTLRASEGLRLLVDRIFVDLGAEPDVALETTDRDMLVPLVAAGLGITLLPDHFARRREVEGVVLRPTDPAVARRVGAIVRADDEAAVLADFLGALSGVWPKG